MKANASNRVTRRAFLVSGAATAATAMAGVQIGVTRNRLRVGLIGPGRYGTTLLQEMETIGSEFDAEIVAIHRDSLDAVQRKGVNAVIIATPDHLHAETAIAALESGLHVFCAPPMAMNAADAYAVRSAAVQSGCVYRVGVESLHETRWQAARALVQSGMIGDVRWVSATTHEFPAGFDEGWRTDPNCTLGAAAHHLHELWAVCAYATGVQQPIDVGAMGGGHETDAALPDALCLSADFAGSVHFNLDCRPAPETAPHAVIRGSIASLIIEHECIVAMPDMPAAAPLHEVWRGERAWEGSPLRSWLRDVRSGQSSGESIEIAFSAATGVSLALDGYRQHAA